VKIKLNKHDWLLISGIAVLLALIKAKGIGWAVDTFASFYVAITVFNWIKEKLEGKNE